MRFEDYPELASFCETSWSRLVAIARFALTHYSRSDQSVPSIAYQDAEELALETIDKHLQFLSARILDTPPANIFNLFRQLALRRARDTVIRNCERPVEGASQVTSSLTEAIAVVSFLTEDIEYKLFRILFQSQKSFLSLVVRLITWPKDRLITVKAKSAFDWLACQTAGQARAREHIMCLPGV
jgi:hypothetical protein